jgi:hypothetical protein
MFEPENLQEILGPEKYEYILDRLGHTDPLIRVATSGKFGLLL